MGIPIPTAESRAAVGTEFLSPYPPHTHTRGNPDGDPHTNGRPGEFPSPPSPPHLSSLHSFPFPLEVGPHCC